MSESVSLPLPWQRESWQQLCDLKRRARLPHALLFAGPAGIGKAQLARALAEWVMCVAPTDTACGNCRACQLHRAGTHPDLIWLAPEESGKAIKVDQVRELTEHLSKTAQQGGYKVAVITPAEAMNQNAANALLKTLEEPAANTLLILLSDSPSALLPTIRSRCQIRTFTTPPVALARPWLMQSLAEVDAAASVDADNLLRLTRGAPLAARDLALGDKLQERSARLADWAALSLGAQSAIAVAGRWYGGDNPALMAWYLEQLHQVLRYLTLRDPAELPEWPAEFIARIERINPSVLHRYLEKVLQSKKQLLSGANPNKQLLWEELLMDWGVVLRAK